MLSCAEFLTEFGEYLEESADPQLRMRLEAHLHECKTCQVILDSTRKTIRFVTESDSFTLPDNAVEPIVGQVMARIRTKNTQRTAQAAAEVSQAVIMGAAQGIILYDSELRYQLFNPFMERLTGKSADEVLGRVAVEVFPRLRTSGIEDVLKRALAGETVDVRDFLVPKHSAGGRDVWESCIFAPHRAADGTITGSWAWCATSRIATSKKSDSNRLWWALRRPPEKISFPTLVRHMASALGTRYAFITDCADQKRAKVLAVWTGDRFGDLFEFDIADTPCMKVLNGEVCHYKEGLQALFPLDTGLVDWGAQSYLGVPMLDSESRVMGHIAILDDKPMERDPHAIDLVKIFASRAAAELKRQKAEVNLQAALVRVQRLEQKNRTLLEITNTIITSLRREELLSAICRVLKDVTTFDCAGLALYDPEVRDLRVFALEGLFRPEDLSIGQLIDCEGRQSGHRWDFYPTGSAK